MAKFEVAPHVVRARIAACFGIAVTSMPEVNGYQVPLPDSTWSVEIDLVGQKYHLVHDLGGMRDTIATYASVSNLLKSLKVRKLIKA